MSQRGDVVIIRFPFVGGGSGKTRPAIVVQTDRLNQRIRNPIVALVTGNISRASKEPSQFLIDPSTPDGASSGLTKVSAVKYENLITVDQSDVQRIVGHLSKPLVQKLESSLKSALELT